MIFVALRDITPGEEITLDYGKDYFDLFIAPLGCRCAACASKAAKIYGRPARRKR
jgi:SET domain-containing protein